MADRERYAQWIVQNQDKAGTPEFETVARAYRAMQQNPELAEATETRKITGPEEPERLIADQDAAEARPGNRFFSGEFANQLLNVPEELQRPSSNQAGFLQRMAGGEASRLAAGAAEPLVGLAQISAMGMDNLMRLMRRDSNLARGIGQQWARIKEYQRGGMDDPEGIDAAGIAGNVASGMALVGRIPQATSLIGNIGQSAATGGTLSAAMPAMSDSPVSETLGQAALGAAVGAAVPAVTGLGRMATDRMTSGGIERSAARLANQAAGSRRDDVIRALREAERGQAAGAVRPNVTAGEAAVPAGSAEFSALQRAAMGRTDPSVRLGIDRAASRIREGQLRAIGGDAQAFRSAEDRVKAQVGALYDDAFKGRLRMTEELKEALKNPFVRQARIAIDAVAESEGIRPGTSRYMHLIKKGMDDIISTPAVEGGLQPTQQRAAARARDVFLAAFEKSNPAYASARQQAAELYRPLNQMQVAQHLEQRLAAPLVDQGGNTASQRAAGYAQALRDAPGTVRRATGFRGSQTIEDIMTPEQMNVINRVGRDLANRADFDELARAGTPKINAMVGDMYAKQVAPMLSRWMMIANNVLKRTAQGASESGMKVLAEKMQSPAEMARIMEAATAAERSQLNNIMNTIMSQSAGRGVSEGAQAGSDLIQTLREDEQ